MNVSDIVGAHKLQYTEESSGISASENIKWQWRLCTYVKHVQCWTYLKYLHLLYTQTKVGNKLSQLDDPWYRVKKKTEVVCSIYMSITVMSGNRIDSYVSRD